MSSTKDNFDFENFTSAMIREIDSMRSIWSPSLKPTSGAGDDNPKTVTDSKPKENRINAFYRGLGLPAVVPEPDKSTAAALNKNNGNIHELKFDDFKNKLAIRQADFSKRVSNEEIKSFADSAGASIIKNGLTKRARGTLLPIIVDGSIIIEDHSRRVAGAYMSIEERLDGKDLYRRPTIETILNIRLKGLNFVNTDIDDAVRADQNTTESNKELIAVGEKKLSDALKSLSDVFNSARDKVERAAKEIGVEVIPTAGNISQQNLETRINTKRDTKLGKQKKEIDDKNRVDAAWAVINKFEDKRKSTSTKNLESSSFSGSILRLFVPDLESPARERERRVNEQIQKNKILAKEAHRALDLVLGTFAGISGADILAVISAMFTVEQNSLIALLNKDAQLRLSERYEGVVSEDVKKIDVETAIKKLLEEVEKNFDIIEEAVLNPPEDETED